MPLLFLQPTLQTPRIRIGKCRSDPVHAHRAFKVEHVVFPTTPRTLVISMIKFLLSKKDTNAIMCNDPASAERSLVVGAIGGLISKLQQRRSHQPPPSRILKILNFSSDLWVGLRRGRLSRRSKWAMKPSFAVPRSVRSLI